jgi:opacity protein-like surface antigen
MLRPLLVAASVAALTPLGASGSAIQPQLTATVTARGIALRAEDGSRVQSLQQNSYRIVVSDRTKSQNFHLIGPSVNLRTRVPAKTSTSWTVYLRPGTYVYRSDKNARLRGTFTVTGQPPPQ